MAVLGGTPAVLGGTYQATASGAIANGDPVKINSNGTVSKAVGAAGLTMYIIGTASDSVNQFALSSTFKITDATFVQARSVSAQETTPQSLAFNTDGTKMFVTGYTSDKVWEYTLGVAYDVSSAVVVDGFSVASQTAVPVALRFNSDGSKMFVLGIGGTPSVFEYALSTNFDVSTASYTDALAVDGTTGTNCYGLAFNNDGTKMFTTNSSGTNSLFAEYALSTGFDVSTASLTDTTNIASFSTGPAGIAFNADGTKVYILNPATYLVNEVTLGTAFDASTINTATIQSFNIIGNTIIQESAPQGMAFGTGVVGQSSYIGIASAAASDGATATIQVIGSIDDASSGLTPGQSVYVSVTGTLTSTTTATVAGVALSASKVLIKGAYSALFYKDGFQKEIV